jgi:hypothetical protein
MTNLEMYLIAIGISGIALLYYGILVKGALRHIDNRKGDNE